MGTEHYAVVQRKAGVHWTAVASFYFGKDYSLFMWIGQRTKRSYPQDIEDFHSLGSDFDDMHNYRVVDCPSFITWPDFDREDGTPNYLWDSLEAVVMTLSEDAPPCRVVFCQDQ
jgi:hypothetical protein